MKKAETEEKKKIRNVKRRVKMEDRAVPPVPPKSLGTIGQDLWRETVVYLMQKKNFSQLDYHVLEIAGKAYEDWRTARTADEATRAAKLFIGIMQKFGATPYARQKIASREQTKKQSASDRDVLEDYDL